MAQFSDLDLIEVLSNSLFVSICLEPQMVGLHHIKTVYMIVCSFKENNTILRNEVWWGHRFQVKPEPFAIETHISTSVLKVKI